MARYWTKLTAMNCGFYMHLNGYVPEAIICVGLGSWPELTIWQWLYPNAKIIGVDPKKRCNTSIGNLQIVKAIAGSRVGDTMLYCRQCRSSQCVSPEKHGQLMTKLHAVTVDSITNGIPGPYFLWIDVEGAELDVLRGAIDTLKQTAWVNVEAQNWGLLKTHAEDVDQWMVQNGYQLKLQHQNVPDRLYYRPIASKP